MGHNPVCRFKNTSLVNGNVNNHWTRRHRFNHFLRNKLWSLCSRNKNGPAYQIRFFHRFSNIIWVRHQGRNISSENIIKLTEPFWIHINNGYFRTQTDSQLGCIGSNHSSPDDCNFSRLTREFPREECLFLPLLFQAAGPLPEQPFCQQPHSSASRDGRAVSGDCTVS